MLSRVQPLTHRLLAVPRRAEEKGSEVGGGWVAGGRLALKSLSPREHWALMPHLVPWEHLLRIPC